MNYLQLNINQKINTKVNKAWYFVFKIRVLKGQFIGQDYYSQLN